MPDNPSTLHPRPYSLLPTPSIEREHAKSARTLTLESLRQPTLLTAEDTEPRQVQRIPGPPMRAAERSAAGGGGSAGGSIIYTFKEGRALNVRQGRRLLRDVSMLDAGAEIGACVCLCVCVCPRAGFELCVYAQVCMCMYARVRACGVCEA